MPNRKARATQNKDFCNCICLMKPEHPNSSSVKKKNKKCPPKHSKPQSKTPQNQKTKPDKKKTAWTYFLPLVCFPLLFVAGKE